MTIGINGIQAKALAQFVALNVGDDQEELALTKQGDGGLYIGGALTSWEVTKAGTITTDDGEAIYL